MTDPSASPKVLHVTLTPTVQAGGVGRYLVDAVHAMAAAGLRQGVAGLTVPGVEEDWADVRDRVELTHAPPKGWYALGYSPPLWRRLPELVEQADVIHLHGLRTLLGWRTRVEALRQNKPLVISPHGQLHPWQLTQRKSKKRITDSLWVRRSIARASAVLAMSQAEADHARSYCPTTPAHVVPIGVDAESFHPGREQAKRVVAESWPGLNGHRLMLYLGMPTERKGIDLLIAAAGQALAANDDWRLVIAGWTSPDQARWLQQLVAESGLAERCVLLGSIDESPKRDLMAAADVLVLPSRAEAFGINVIESLASGTPVLTTTAAPWPDLPGRACGWVVQPTIASIADGITKLLSTSPSEIEAMGQRGRAWVQSDFDWKPIAQRLIDFYTRVAVEHQPQA